MFLDFLKLVSMSNACSCEKSIDGAMLYDPSDFLTVARIIA
jgi:hypothetical protein